MKKKKNLDVRCVICEKQILNPTCATNTCGTDECKTKYQRYLVWRKREDNKKAKDYKLLKIKKTKRNTK